MNENNENALRQYSLIDEKVEEWRKNDEGKLGICTKKFKANYVIKNLSQYKVGDVIEIDNKKIIITIMGKDCYAKECPLFQKLNHSCQMVEGVGFGMEQK